MGDVVALVALGAQPHVIVGTDRVNQVAAVPVLDSDVLRGCVVSESDLEWPTRCATVGALARQLIPNALMHSAIADFQHLSHCASLRAASDTGRTP